VIELPRCDLPPLTRLTDHSVVTQPDVVEELFAEIRGSINLLDPVRRDARVYLREFETRLERSTDSPV